ncbi:MAG: NAD(+)/NADH kinase [Clostridia bacterium]|nr:NAD(+)/NADH kinase [Clostridia bacterium]
MKNIVLIPNEQKDVGYAVTKEVIEILRSFGARIYIDEALPLVSDGVTLYSAASFPKDAELLLVIGGDGTMLHAAALALQYDVPLLGINMGRLGYLTTVERSELALLSRLQDDTYTVEERMTLSLAILDKDGHREELSFFALNEIVASGMGHLADIRLFEGGESLDYRADGLILATPTGSTAYSLSAGGPVMEDSMNAVCVTPICPRSFFSRSLLFSADAVLRLESLGARRDGLRVTVDGRESFVLKDTDALEIKQADKKVRILSLQPKNLLRVLCTKMKMNHF